MRNNIGKAVATVFVLSFVAKIVGFLKSVIQASYYGATIETDAFNVANGFENNVLYMLTMAISVAFVPLYIQHKKNSSKNEEKRFASRIITILFVLALGISLIFFVFAPYIIYVIAPSYDGEIAHLTIRYFRVLTLGFAFSLAAHMYVSLLNAEKIYGYSAFSSIINSIVIIFFALFYQNSLGVWALVISIPISYLIQWAVLYFRGRKFATLSLQHKFNDESVQQLIIQAAPVLLSQATVEINQVVDRALLTGVATGALTAVSYAAILFQFASTLIAGSLSTVMFTELSEAGANSDNERIKSILKVCYKFIFIICVPIVVSMFFNSFDIVTIVYGHGKYPLNSIYQSSIALQIYGLCLLPVCIKSVLSRAYYSLNDTRKPMLLGVLEVILKISLSITLVKTFGIVGVVGSTAISSIALIIAMLIDFNKKYLKVLDVSSLRGYWKIIFSTLLLVITMNGLSNIFIINHLVDFVLKSLLAFLLYFGVLTLLKEEMIITLKKKFMIKLKKFIKI